MIRILVNIRKLERFSGGFTLIELILYVLIFAIVGTLAAGVFSFVIKSKIVISRSSEVQLNVQRITEQIVDRVHSSLAINDASSTLSLKMADVNKDPTIFALASGTITIKEGGSVAAPMSPSTTIFTALNFTKIDNPAPATSSVQIKITGGYNENGTTTSDTLYNIQTTALPL
ncbi:MAG: prepilin-type N-terminal cleavage/methylation domain-containing protein [Patescibacteria group bacterium]